jgi:hypothetical protein
MKRSPLFLALALLICLTPLHGKDYQLIEQLPKKLAQAQAEGHKGWDTGNTLAMKEATHRYNDTLTSLIKELASAYYPKKFITKEEIDGYLKALYTIHRFKQNATNPTGEFQGTVASLEVPSSVSDDLENTISGMVEAIVVDDPKFDFEGWKKKWQEAKK